MNSKNIRHLLIGDFTLKRIMRSLIFIYVSIGLYVYFFADRMIFQPQSASYNHTQDFLKLTTSDGVEITALYLPNPEAKYTILFSHGNAEDLGDIRFLLVKLQKMGFAVFAYDYRGYGTSAGTPSEKNAYQDINAAYSFLTENLKIPSQQIIIYGRSVGSGPSVDLASRESVAGLVLESSFTTAFRVMTVIPIFPFDKFANINKIKQVNAPVLIMHGTKDDLIPMWHSEKLFAAANEPKKFIPIANAGHNDLIQIAGDRYPQIMQEFAKTLKSK